MNTVTSDINQHENPDSIVDVLKKSFKIVLALGAAVALFVLFGMATSAPNDYTGGGVIKVAVPVSSVGCMVTVSQDNGKEAAYMKTGALSCFGYYIGKRVEITNGKIA